MWRVASLAAVAVVAASVVRAAPPSITRTLPVEGVRRFDPRWPPADMPPMPATWSAAATHCYYTVRPRLDVAEVVVQRPGECEVLAAVREVALGLELLVESWLPLAASPRIVEHERGHRRICVRVYDDAAEAGREAADSIIARTFVGRAPTCREASERAVEGAAVSLLRTRYNALTADAARRAPRRRVLRSRHEERREPRRTAADGRGARDRSLRA